MNTAFLLAASLHPSAEVGPLPLAVLQAAPYGLVLLTAWAVRGHRTALAVLLLGVAAVGALSVMGHYRALQDTLWLLDARAAGRRAMNCGPPAFLVLGCCEYAATAVYVALAGLLSHFRTLA